jgi:anti-sigma regulatory factor (Ser/Thr protein kinase)
VTASDEVRLQVPASPEFLRLARVTAAGLAGRLGFNYDEVEDLRLAIDELCFGLTGPSPRPGTVELRYVLDGDTLVVEGRGHFADDAAPAQLTELSQVILSALVDEHRLGAGPDGPTFWMVKQHHDIPEPGDMRAPDA